MNNPDMNQLDSMLSYIANRDGNRPPSFFDKEIRSFLLMSTELVPISIQESDKPQNPDLAPTIGDLNIPNTLNAWDDDRGFPVADSSYLNSQGILQSPLTGPQNGINCSRHNSIDFLSLPDPAYNHAATIDPANPYSSTIPPSSGGEMNPLNQNSFFDNSNSLNEDVIANLPLPPVSIESTKRPSSSMSPSVSNGMDEDPEVVKKRRRLEKNRQTAKTCRQRKKERKEAIQEEILKLRDENTKLRHQLESLSDESRISQQHAEEHKQFMDQMKQCLANNDEEGILKSVNSYYVNWSKLGEERSTQAELHLEQLKMLLLPTQMSKMCLWSMGQEAEFYDEKLNNLKYGGSIWNILSQACSFTDEQKKAIISSRSGMLRQQENIASVLDIVNKVQEMVKSNIESMHEQLKGILNVLTPTQQAKFMIWMEKGMNGPDLISSIKKVLQLHNQASMPDLGDDSMSLSLSENDSLSSLSNL